MPPINYSITVFDDQCPATYNGAIVVTINGGCPDYTIELQQIGDTAHQTVTQSGPVIKLFNLGPGQYMLEITDLCSNQILDTVIVGDGARWPVNPWNDDRAFGVDIVCDNKYNVYAMGYFTGHIQFDPPANSAVIYSGSNQISNGYLVKFDQCGQIIWEKQIGQPGTGYCITSSLCLDSDENVLVCGEFTGTINFSGVMSLSNASQYYDGFLACYDKSTGNCLWCCRMASSGADYAKGVAADQFGNIFVIGDFSGSHLDLYNSYGLLGFPSLMNYSPPGKDNFLVAYNSDGYVLDARTSELSMIGDDHAGGISCFKYNYGPHPWTEVLLTGDISFAGIPNLLLQRWIFGYGSFPPAFTLISNYILSSNGSTNIVGKAIETSAFGQGTNASHFVFVGKKIDPFGSHPVIGIDVCPPLGMLPGIPNIYYMSNPLNIINSFASANNAATDIAFDRHTFSFYLCGYMNESGHHPVNSQCFYPPLTPAQDFFIDRFDDQVPYLLSSCVSSWSESHTMNFVANYNDPEFFGAASDNNHKLYITGSYVDVLSTPASQGLNISNNGGNSHCFISRIWDNGSTLYHKNEFIKPGNNLAGLPEIELLVLPNPVSNEVTVSLTDGSLIEGSLEVYGIDGTLVDKIVQVKAGQAALALDLGFLRPGAYLLGVHTILGTRYAKLIKL